MDKELATFIHKSLTGTAGKRQVLCIKWLQVAQASVRDLERDLLQAHSDLTAGESSSNSLGRSLVKYRQPQLVT